MSETTSVEMCPDCGLPMATERNTRGAHVDKMLCGGRFSAHYELECKRVAVSKLRSEVESLIRLNPYARHDIDSKPPDDPLGRFLFGIRYYAGMLDDGDNWGHGLGHIQELCKEFDAAIAERAGHPPPEEEWEAAFARVYKSLATTDRERMAFSCGWAAKAEQAPPRVLEYPGQPTMAELFETVRDSLSPAAHQDYLRDALTELERRIGVGDD